MNNNLITEQVNNQVTNSLISGEVYLKDAPKGPYRDLVKSLVSSVHNLRGTCEDFRSDLRMFPIHIRLTGEETFEMVCDSPEVAEAFAKAVWGQEGGDEGFSG